LKPPSDDCRKLFAHFVDPTAIPRQPVHPESFQNVSLLGEVVTETDETVYVAHRDKHPLGGGKVAGVKKLVSAAN
jgi:hypothetical protein